MFKNSFGTREDSQTFVEQSLVSVEVSDSQFQFLHLHTKQSNGTSDDLRSTAVAFWWRLLDLEEGLVDTLFERFSRVRHALLM